jgi:hypothetical protein
MISVMSSIIFISTFSGMLLVVVVLEMPLLFFLLQALWGKNYALHNFYKLYVIKILRDFTKSRRTHLAYRKLVFV